MMLMTAVHRWRDIAPARARRGLRYVQALASLACVAATMGCPSPFDPDVLSMLQDRVAPAVAFTAPSAGSKFQSTATIAGIVTDYDGDGVARSGSANIKAVSYLLQGDESAATGVELSDDGAFEFDVATASFDSQITIVVSAEDVNGNQGSGSITLAPDGEGPFLAITSPSDFGEYATAITLSGYVRNSAADSAISEVSAEVSYKIPGTALAGNLALGENGAFSVVLDVSAFSASLAIEVTATDLNGNGTVAIVTIVKPSDGGDVSEYTVSPGNKSVTIAWDPVPFAESYSLSELQYSGETIDGVTSPFVWEGLENGVLYSFKLTAHVPAESGSDAESAEIKAMPLSARTLCPSVKEVGYRSVSIEWEAFDSVSEYTLERSLSPDGPWKIRRKLASNEFTDTGLAHDTAYYYRVYPTAYTDIVSSSVAAVPARFISGGAALMKNLSTITAVGAAASGSYAYVASGGSGLTVIDISDAATSSAVATLDTAGTANAVKVSGNYAYVADGGSGLAIVDISNPRAPVARGVYDTAGTARDIAVSGGYAYIADDSNGLVVVDVSNPAAPAYLGKYQTTGSAYGVAVSGGFAYVADRTNGLYVVDVSSPSAPVYAGKYGVTTGYNNGVDVRGSYAYVINAVSGLLIIDVSNPASPTVKGTYTPSSTGGRSVALIGDLAYISGTFGLLAIDVSAPASPALSTSYASGSDTYGAAILGDFAYVACNTSGLRVLNVHIPIKPGPSGSFNTAGSAYGVALAGSYAYVADGTSGLAVIDVSDPASPVLKGTCDTAGEARGVAVAGDFAYVGDWGGGLVVIDVSDPEAPRQVGACALFASSGARSVALAGDYAYVADQYSLEVVDISDPASPTLVCSYTTGVSCTMGVSISGDYAYIADYTGGLSIVDVSYPLAPKWVNALDTVAAMGVAVGGKHAYIAEMSASDGNELIAMSVAAPAAPTKVGSYSYAASNNGVAVAVSGNIVCYTDNLGNVVVVNAADPASLSLAGACALSAQANGIAVSGGYAYAAAGASGLAIIRIRGLD